jgi:hypothetical protein
MNKGCKAPVILLASCSAYAARAAVIALLLVLTGCVREVIYTVDDMYAAFPEAEILGASFYYQRGGQDVTGDDAGMISRNEDGTYQVKIRRRAPSSSPSAMYITGSFEFSEYYKMTCTFPEDPAIADKPYRVYACASRGMDAASDADYPTASDLMGEAVFRNGVAIGEFTMTNEGINLLNPDRQGRPYITLFLYLFFSNVSNPDDYYEFTLNFAGGANGVTPASVVKKAEIYRAGDAAHKFALEATEEEIEVEDPVFGLITVKKATPILARFNHRFDSRKVLPALPLAGTSGLCVDLQVPDAGKDLVFEIRNVGLYGAADPLVNLITGDMIKGARIEGLSAAQFAISEHEITAGSYFYRVKARVAQYEGMTGVKMVIPGSAEAFAGTDRFTFTLNVPDKYEE